MKLKVLTYNIHKGIGGVDRRYKPERVAEVIAGHSPDVVLLQEVDEGVARSARHRQVDWFSERLGFNHCTWFPNVEVRGGGTYGNAILSRFPLETHCNIDLTVPPRKRRSVLHAALKVVDDQGHQRTVHVFNMHLGLVEGERRTQVGTFLESHPFAGLHADTPVIVAGDLNDVWGSLGQRLAPAGFSGADKIPRTFPAWAPMRALDGIYVRGAARLLELSRCDSVLAKRASDHRPLVADIEMG